MAWDVERVIEYPVSNALNPTPASTELVEEIKAYGEHCMNTDQGQVAELMFKCLSALSASNKVVISRECAENAAAYANSARVLHQRDIDAGLVGGTEGLTYIFRDEAAKCHEDIKQALQEVIKAKQ